MIRRAMHVAVFVGFGTLSLTAALTKHGELAFALGVISGWHFLIALESP